MLTRLNFILVFLLSIFLLNCTNKASTKNIGATDSPSSGNASGSSSSSGSTSSSSGSTSSSSGSTSSSSGSTSSSSGGGDSAFVATLSSQPTGTNNSTALNVTVGGAGIVAYRFKVGDSGTDCSSLTSYSADVLIATPITENISAIADGAIILCVVGKDGLGLFQAYASATSATWTKDATAPTVPSGISLGGVTALNIETPTITVGTPSTDAVGSITYEAQLYDSSGTSTVGSPTVFTSGQKISGLSLTSSTVYTLKVRAKDSAGNVSSYSSLSASWTAQFACPTGYIEVPALSPYTATNFCVAKYEMKCQGIGCGGTTATNVIPGVTSVAVSIAGQSQNYVGPWVAIDRDQSITACQNIGAGYDLISNAQWQTISRNIADQAANWGASENTPNESSAYGAASLSFGHVDGTPNNALDATDDTDPCYGTGQTCSQSNWSNQRRTNVLSNGNVIWDLSGNVWEWVKDNNNSSQGADGDVSTIPSGAQQTNFGNDQVCLSPSSGSYCGFGYTWSNYSAGAILRGASWHNNGLGVFTSFMQNGPAVFDASVGFRCVFQP